MAQNSPDERLVYLALKNASKGADALIRKPKKIRELIQKTRHNVDVAPVDVSRLWKNTREEVMWLNALLPWQRSPGWILLRVAIQLTFARLAGSRNPSADYYKTFMVFLLGKVLQLSFQYKIHCDMLYAMNAKLGRCLFKLDPSVPIDRNFWLRHLSGH